MRTAEVELATSLTLGVACQWSISVSVFFLPYPRSFVLLSECDRRCQLLREKGRPGVRAFWNSRARGRIRPARSRRLGRQAKRCLGLPVPTV